VLPGSGYPPYTLRLAAYATATGRPLQTFLTERHQVESMPGGLAADPSGRYLPARIGTEGRMGGDPAASGGGLPSPAF
jgi:hypothetical protein